MDLENKNNTYTLNEINKMFSRYITKRLSDISSISGLNEYDYSETIGRIKELESLMESVQSREIIVENKNK